MNTSIYSATTALAAAAPDTSHLNQRLSDLTLVRRAAHRAAVALLIWSLHRTASTDHPAHVRRHQDATALQEREHRALLLEPYLVHRH